MVISTPPKPLEWSGQVISFDPTDHLSNVARVGALPLIVLPVIHNFRVTKMLVDGGSSLNLLSCLGRVTLGVKDTPFLGSARGTKEAVDLFSWREFVDEIGRAHV